MTFHALRHFQGACWFNKASILSVERSGLEHRFDVKGGYRHIRLVPNPKDGC
jgi:hypothetical protein